MVILIFYIHCNFNFYNIFNLVILRINFVTNTRGCSRRRKRKRHEGKPAKSKKAHRGSGEKNRGSDFSIFYSKDGVY